VGAGVGVAGDTASSIPAAFSFLSSSNRIADRFSASLLLSLARSS
jgi:hypothetical protein